MWLRILFLFYIYFFCGFTYAQKLYLLVNQRKAGNLIGRDNDVKGLYQGEISDSTWRHLGWKNNIVWDVVIDDAPNPKSIWLGCLNGVMRSIDEGKSWKILTDWQLQDVLKVYIDKNNPQEIYALTAWGLWKSDDWGETWVQRNKGLKPTNQTFTTTLLFSHHHPQRLLMGTANGIVISTNKGKKWRTLALEGQEIHTLIAHYQNDDILFCGTEDKGIGQSQDAGRTWQFLNLGLETNTIYEIVQHPNNPEILYCGGHQSGLYITQNGGKTWQLLDNELKNKSIKSICLYSFSPEIIFVGCIDGGLYKSINGGKNFTCVGQSDGRVWKVMIK
jgi:photosystem II stability/assembly factor-like uncharacterized protein